MTLAGIVGRYSNEFDSPFKGGVDLMWVRSHDSKVARLRRMGSLAKPPSEEQWLGLAVIARYS